MVMWGADDTSNLRQGQRSEQPLGLGREVSASCSAFDPHIRQIYDWSRGGTAIVDPCDLDPLWTF